MDRPPQSTIILIPSIVHLIAIMVSSFQNWYGFVEENSDVINNPQMELFHEHLTHLLTFSGLLWCLLLGIIGMNIRTILSVTNLVPVFFLVGYPPSALFS